jgi:exopolysaccharide production protein ExoZ
MSVLSGDGAQGMSAAAPQPDANKRYEGIEVLRFVAALMVVVLHSTFYVHERLEPGFPVYGQGGNGVRLFFVISGFVMITSSQRLIEALHGWRVFAVKRIIRIVPLYWAVTSLKLAILLATPAVVLHSGADWGHIAKSYFFIPAKNPAGEISPFLGVGWTLNFEMFFYALFAVAMLTRSRPIAFTAPVLVALSLLSFVKTSDWPAPLFFFCDPIVLDFLAGMLVARWAVRGARLPDGVSYALALAGLVGLFGPWPFPGDATPAGAFLDSSIRTILSSSIVLAAVSLEPRLSGRVPSAVLFMGAASYSLYLIHPIVAPAVPHVLAGLGWKLPWLALPVSVAVACLAAAIAYRCFEMPVTRIAQSVAKRRALLDPAASASTPASAGALAMPSGLERQGSE